MIEINEKIGAHLITRRIAQSALDRFQSGLVGAEFGVAYGGGVESIGKLWKGKGTVHGFDTFSTHPEDLAWSPTSWEARCMDGDYSNLGKEKLTYEYQRAELDRQGLDNVVLHPGRINDHSLDGVNHLHYVLLDLDFISSMLLAYMIASPKVVSGGYLCLHDVVPRGVMPGLWGLYHEIMASGYWYLESEYHQQYMAVLQRR